MTCTDPSLFIGVERTWLSKEKFASLVDKYLDNRSPGSTETTGTVDTGKTEKTFIDSTMYEDIKRVLNVSMMYIIMGVIY